MTVAPEQVDLPEKQQVARSFGLAARHYERVAVLQKLVAERLLEKLDIVKIDPRWMLDLGAGTGVVASGLRKKYRRAKLLQLDIALPMLLCSRKKTQGWWNKQRYVCADAEQLPLIENTMDLICSNLMLQWCRNIDLAFNDVARTLDTNGLFLFSTFGPDTLKELRDSWMVADNKTHVNSFIDMHDLGDALVRAGFEQPVMEVENFTLTYNDVYALMRELKQLGAHNVSSNRQRSMTGKNALQTMVDAYEKKRVEGKIPATFEVVYGHAWKPAKAVSRSIQPDVSVFPVSALKRRNN